MKFKLEAVIFDMDGVITNTMPDHFRVWRAVLAEEGVHVTHFDVYSREGQTGTKALKEIFRKYNVACDVKKLKKVIRKKEELFKQTVRTRFIVGARSFVRSLHRSGIRLALVTGTSRHELHRIFPDPLYRLFDVVVTGSDVRHGKPSAEPYAMALKRLGIRPADAVAVENAPLGILSARRAGLKCLALETSLPRKHLKGALRVFSSIKELRAKVGFEKIKRDER